MDGETMVPKLGRGPGKNMWQHIFQHSEFGCLKLRSFPDAVDYCCVGTTWLKNTIELRSGPPVKLTTKPKGPTTCIFVHRKHGDGYPIFRQAVKFCKAVWPCGS
jgi:hypothetical protein